MATTTKTMTGTGVSDFLNAVNKKSRDEAWASMDTDIAYQGKQIVLPNEPVQMSYDAAIKTLERKAAEDEQTFDVNENIDGIPWDAAVATYKAIQRLYGFATSSAIKTFFGKINPQYFTVQTGLGDNDYVQVPIGQLELPGDDAKFVLDVVRTGVRLRGSVNKKARARLLEIANEAKKIMLTESIYRGKAIRLRVQDNGDLDIAHPPRFIDLNNVKESDIIFDDLTKMLIDSNIFSPIKHADRLRARGDSLKRGILLEGPYGTGKSLTAKVAAKVACDHGWTFILLARSQGFKSALEFGKNIQPLVIFAEDADRNADRTVESVNDLINTLDTVDTKNNEIMLITTTNHVERIDKALLRPGRFDAIITLDPPNADTVKNILRHYAGDLLAESEDLTEASKILAGQVPASIHEVVKRAINTMFMRGHDVITGKELAAQAHGMKKHFELISNHPDLKTQKDYLWEAFQQMVSETLKENLKPVEDKLAEIQDSIE